MVTWPPGRTVRLRTPGALPWWEGAEAFPPVLRQLTAALIPERWLRVQKKMEV